MLPGGGRLENEYLKPEPLHRARAAQGCLILQANHPWYGLARNVGPPFASLSLTNQASLGWAHATPLE